MTLKFLSTGESHGQALIAVLDGFPAGLKVNLEKINLELLARQSGYGRSSRQKIETDQAEFISGLRHGITSGAPISILIHNRDFNNWRYVMSPEAIDLTEPEAQEQLEKKSINYFRPGHADLSGTLKFRHNDIRDVAERASARETAARVAAGALCEQLLNKLQIKLVSHVIAIGFVKSNLNSESLSLDDLANRVKQSEMFCIDPETTTAMLDIVKKSWQDGDTLGGIIELVAEGLPVGLGSYTQWDKKLDGLLAQAILSIPAIKAFEIGEAINSTSCLGSQVHDALFPANNPSTNNGNPHLPFSRTTNRAGGLEGGMTNGARLCMRAYMKPLPTLRQGLPSVSFPEFQARTAHYERSDVCAVPAASVVGKAMTSFVLTCAILEKFGSDNLTDIEASLANYKKYCQHPTTSSTCDPVRSSKQ